VIARNALIKSLLWKGAASATPQTAWIQRGFSLRGNLSRPDQTVPGTVRLKIRFTYQGPNARFIPAWGEAPGQRTQQNQGL